MSLKNKDLLAMNTAELRRLRDSATSTEKWCLYNACIRLREAVQKNRSLDAAAWDHIVKELFKNTEDI